jgi:hypothetical protein
MWWFAIVAMERGAFGCALPQGLVLADPTKPLLPNPNSCVLKSASMGNLSHRERLGYSPLGASYGIKSDALVLTTDRIFAT